MQSTSDGEEASQGILREVVLVTFIEKRVIHERHSPLWRGGEGVKVVFGETTACTLQVSTFNIHSPFLGTKAAPQQDRGKA